MDKKKWTWVLIVIVSGLWGYNIYNTVKTFGGEDPQPFQETNQFTHLSLNLNKDSFLLILPSRDPFLDKAFQKSVDLNGNNSAIENATKPKIVHEPIIKKKEWPKIEYYGFVKNRSQNHSLCLVSIDQKIFKVSEGEMQNEVTVIGISADSIALSYNDEIRSFKK